MKNSLKVERNCSFWQWTATNEDGTPAVAYRLFDTEQEAIEDARSKGFNLTKKDNVDTL